MTPIKKTQPSSHDAFVGNWKPTKNDTLAKRGPTFGTTMNILYGDLVCGQGDIDAMNTIISHYLYYLDLMGVSREQAGPNDQLTCAEQVAFNPSKPASTASSWGLKMTFGAQLPLLFDGLVLSRKEPLRIRLGQLSYLL